MRAIVRDALGCLVIVWLLLVATIVDVQAKPAPQPLALSVYPGCSTATRSLWEIEADRAGRVEIATDPSFRPRHIQRVRPGDTFVWTRSSVIYVRDRAAPTNVLSAVVDGTDC